MIAIALALAILSSLGEAGLDWARARGHTENGEFAQAIEQWTTLTARFPNSVQAWTSLAQATRRAERFDRCEDAIERALAIDANYDPANWQLGLLHNLRQRPQEALDAFDRIGAGEAQSTFHYQRGIALRALARDDAAVEALRRAVELDDQLFAARYALYLLLRSRNRVEAAAELESIEALRRKQPEWRRNDQLRLEAGPLSNIDWPGAYSRLSIKPLGRKFRLHLRGVRAREDGVGSTVEIWTPEFLFRRRYEGNPQTFFAGRGGRIAVLRIVWPHGVAQNLFDLDVEVDSEFEVREEIFIKGSWGGVKIQNDEGGRR